MTSQPHSTVQSAVVTYGAYLILFGGLIAYGIRARLRELRERREREAAQAAERLRAARRHAESRRRVPLATVGARIPARRLPAYYECERIWDATVAMGEPPDVDLLDEWERFAAEVDRRADVEWHVDDDDEGIAY